MDLGSYLLTKENIKILYKPYVIHLKKIEENILLSNDRYDYHGIVISKKFNWKDSIKYLWRLFNRSHNIYHINHILKL